MTPRQQQLYDFICRYMADTNGVSPSFDEMRESLGLKSKAGIHRILCGLEERGYIKRHARLGRSITVVQSRSAPTPVVALEIAVQRVREVAGPELTLQILEALVEVERTKLASMTIAPSPAPPLN